MPAKRPGARTVRVRTDKAAARVAAALDAVLDHGEPCVESGFAGIAHKSANPPPMVANTANAALAVQIAVGETFVIDLDGAHPIADALMPGGIAVGSEIYIRDADDVLVDAAEALTGGVIEAGYHKFGRVEDLTPDAGDAFTEVNLSQRAGIR